MRPVKFAANILKGFGWRARAPISFSRALKKEDGNLDRLESASLIGTQSWILKKRL